MAATVPWHVQATPFSVNRFNPRCLEDRVSRRTWTNNVTKRDREAEKRRIFDTLKKKYPSYTSYDIMRMMRSI